MSLYTNCRTLLPLLALISATQIACNADRPGPPPKNPGVKIDPERSLVIRTTQVTDSSDATGTGEWSFGGVFATAFASDNDARAGVRDWLLLWTVDQRVNGDLVSARLRVRELVIEPWKTRDGVSGIADDKWLPKLENAPFRLLAIVNRMDLRGTSADGKQRDAGEGRFVYCLLDASGSLPGKPLPADAAPLPFTAIFEFGLPSGSDKEVKAWARRWADLSSAKSDSAFLRQLTVVTRQFAARNLAPQNVNGSNLHQLRTNDFALGQPWQLREFTLSAAISGFVAATTKQTPAFALDNSQALRDFLENPKHREQLLSERGLVLPDSFGATSILGGAAELPFQFQWKLPGPPDEEVRHAFAFQTCNGCHHVETGIDTEVAAGGAGFTHIRPRKQGEAAALSGFMKGTLKPGQHELADREQELLKLLGEAPQVGIRSTDVPVRQRGVRVH